MAFRISAKISPRATSVDPQPAAKHMDIVLGFDFHVLKVPMPITPCPVTPFCGLIFDPMDYIHCTIPAMPVYDPNGGFTLAKDVPLGCTVLINGFYRGAAMTSLLGLPSVPPVPGKFKRLSGIVKKLNLLHFVIPDPMFLMPKFFHPHEGQVSHGSKTVITQGQWQSTLNCNAFSCQDMGRILLNNPTGGFYLNHLTRITAVLPMGKPVLIGGAKAEQPMSIADLMNALLFMGIMHGVKFSMKITGKLLTRLMKAMETKHPSFSKFRKAVQPFVCKYLGEPVDAASGHMASNLGGFSLPGPLPFEWKVGYYSDSRYDGPLGKNMYHSYDISLLVNDADELVVMNDTSGRPIVFPTLRPGDKFYNPESKYELHRDAHGDYFVEHKDGLRYRFNQEQGSGSLRHRPLRSIEDRNGFSILFSYDKGALSEINDSSGRLIKVETDKSGKITALRMPDPNGKIGVTVTPVRYEYDEEDRLIVSYDGDGYHNRLDWEERLISRRRFPDGTCFEFHYDEKERCLAALGPEDLFSYRFSYLESCTKVTNSLGVEQTYYHQNGIVTKIVDSFGAEEFFTYDEASNLIAESDKSGRLKTYTYDERGNMTGMSIPGQGNLSIIYNEENNPVRVTLPNNGVWEYAYDNRANLLQRTDPLGFTTTYGYRCDGLAEEILRPGGGRTRVSYNDDRLISCVELPDGGRISYKYDGMGRCVSICNPEGGIQYRRYDLRGNIIGVDEADGNIRHIEYDSMSNAVYAKDRHEEVELSYNFFGKVTSRRQGGTGLSFRYNTEGELIEVVNEAQESYLFELDTEGRVVGETGFDGLSRRYQRNQSGQIIRQIKPDDSVEAYEYNASGQIITVYHEADGSSEQYDYDKSGLLVKALNGEAEVKLERDVMGRILRESCNDHTISSSYNELGLRTHVTSSLGADISHIYDTSTGNLTGMDSNGWQARMEHNLFGGETLRRLSGGISLEQSYDQAGRLRHQRLRNTENPYLHRRDYLWDADRLKGVKDSATGEKLFKHDVYGNLSEVIYGDGKVEYRCPDAVGNLFESRERTDRHYSKGGRLEKSLHGEYLYDRLGNLVEKRETGKSGSWKYEWNCAGMLSRVIRPDGEEVCYGYDALGRRLWKRFQSTTTRWLWDGNVPLHEWSEENDITTWIFENGSFSPSAKLQNEKSYSIINDHLGTPIQGYAEDGKQVWGRELNSRGKARLLKGDADFCPFTYQGQIYDKDINLTYNRFRYYDPEDGRYISQDPIGLASGEPNFYAYVSDTNTQIDPFGLECGKAHSDVYKGVREASRILKERGLPRQVRQNILQSFDARTIKVRLARNNEYGIRFHDNGLKATANGRYLFETFPASRNSLAINHEWNDMTHIRQWQIKKGTLLFEGAAAPQGNLSGGQIQKFVVDNPVTSLI